MCRQNNKIESGSDIALLTVYGWARRQGTTMLSTDDSSTRLTVQEQRSLAGSLIGVGCGRWRLCLVEAWVGGAENGLASKEAKALLNNLTINLLRNWIVEALLILCSWELLVMQSFGICQRVRKKLKRAV
jgi:hypothetical protein